MTPEDPGEAHPAPLSPSIPLDRLVSVVRTGGVVTAGAPEHVGERGLVKTDQGEDEPRHERTPELRIRSPAAAASASKSAKGRTSAAGRAMRTTSKPLSPAGPPSSASKRLRAASRNRRRARFRSTARRSCLLTVTPTRFRPEVPGSAKAI